MYKQLESGPFGNGTFFSKTYRGRRFRALSGTYLLDTEERAQPADHRRSVRRPRSGSASARTKTRSDSPRHWASYTEWNRSRSTNPQDVPRMQDTFRESGILC